jgi:hypothetical protein
MNTGYKSKYTKLLAQHVALSGEIVNLLIEVQQLKTALGNADSIIDRQSESLDKANAAAVSKIEKGIEKGIKETKETKK